MSKAGSKTVESERAGEGAYGCRDKYGTLNSMSDEILVAIVGGGVVGCAVARELAGKFDGIFLFEKNVGITQGENQSSRNSGVVHSGIYYDQETRPEKAALCVEGNRLLYAFCEDYQVPALRTGKLIVATNSDHEATLDLYLGRARDNGLDGVERISRQAIRKLEPNVAAQSALLIPSAGIVDPVSLVYRLHVLAHQQGVHFMVGTEVKGIEGQTDGIELTFQYPDEARDRIKARVLINAAGIEADQMARQLDPDSPYELDPVGGESYKFYSDKRPGLSLAGMNVYPTPETVVTPHGRHFTVGVHLTPTFADLSYPPSLGTMVTVGPKLVPVERGNARVGARFSAKVFLERVQPFFPGLREDDLSWHQIGVQARLKNFPDFNMVFSPRYPHVINLLGIDSPGLTASLAIARRVKAMVDELV